MTERQRLRNKFNSLKKEIKRNLNSISREISKTGFISISYIDEKLKLISKYSGDLANIKNTLGTN